MGKHTLLELVDFEDFLKKRNLSPNSIYVYTSAIKRFLIDIPLSVDKEKFLMDIENYNEFIFNHAIKKRSNYFYDALKLFIRFKFDKLPLMNQLLRGLIKPKILDPKKHVRYLSDDERFSVIKLLTNSKHRAMALIQNSTGLRAGDVLRIKAGGISWEADEERGVPVLRIDSEGKGRRHIIKWVYDDFTKNYIDLFIKSNLLDSEYIFLEQREGVPLELSYRSNYNAYLKDLKQALNLSGSGFKDWATHDFRRSYARNVWNMYKDPVILKEMLDHVRFDTSLRYLRNSGLNVKDATHQMSVIHKVDNT